MVVSSTYSSGLKTSSKITGLSCYYCSADGGKREWVGVFPGQSPTLFLMIGPILMVVILIWK